MVKRYTPHPILQLLLGRSILFATIGPNISDFVHLCLHRVSVTVSNRELNVIQMLPRKQHLKTLSFMIICILAVEQYETIFRNRKHGVRALLRIFEVKCGSKPIHQKCRSQRMNEKRKSPKKHPAHQPTLYVYIMTISSQLL